MSSVGMFFFITEHKFLSLSTVLFRISEMKHQFQLIFVLLKLTFPFQYPSMNRLDATVPPNFRQALLSSNLSHLFWWQDISVRNCLKFGEEDHEDEVQQSELFFFKCNYFKSNVFSLVIVHLFCHVWPKVLKRESEGSKNQTSRKLQRRIFNDKNYDEIYVYFIRYFFRREDAGWFSWKFHKNNNNNQAWVWKKEDTSIWRHKFSPRIKKNLFRQNHSAPQKFIMSGTKRGHEGTEEIASVSRHHIWGNSGGTWEFPEGYIRPTFPPIIIEPYVEPPKPMWRELFWLNPFRSSPIICPAFPNITNEELTQLLVGLVGRREYPSYTSNYISPRLECLTNKEVDLLFSAIVMAAKEN